MTVYFDAGRQKWRFHFAHKGKRHTGYCVHPKTGALAKNKTQALAAEAAIKDTIKAASPALNTPPPAIPYGGFTLAEALTAYLKSCGPKNLQNAKTYCRDMIEFFGPACPLDAVSDRVEAYQSYLMTKGKMLNMGGALGSRSIKTLPEGLSPRSVNHRLKALVAAFKALKSLPENRHIRNLVPEPPEVSLLKVPRRIPTPFSQEAAQAVLDELVTTGNDHIRLAFILCLHTGMRKGECVSIRTGQYRTAERVILLDASQTKTGVSAYVYVNDAAAAVLEECRQLGDELWAQLSASEAAADEARRVYGIAAREDIPFILYRPSGGRSLRPVRSITGSSWRKLKDRHGMTFRWHDLRAAFCSNLLALGTDVVTVQELARHASLEATMHYLKGADPNKRQAVDKLAAMAKKASRGKPAHRIRTQDRNKQIKEGISV